MTRQVRTRIQDLLIERGLTVHQLNDVFNELDESGDGTLDWGEFKQALKMLDIQVPISKVRALFAMFDEDESGEIEYLEFCRLLFPNMDELPGFSEPTAEDGQGETTSPDGCGTPSAWPAGGGIPPPSKNRGGGIPPPRKFNNMCRQLQATEALSSGGANAVAAAGLLAMAGRVPAGAPSEADQSAALPTRSNPFAKMLAKTTEQSAGAPAVAAEPAATSAAAAGSSLAPAGPDAVSACDPASGGRSASSQE